jgi:hypothetical protein
VLTLN